MTRLKPTALTAPGKLTPPTAQARLTTWTTRTIQAARTPLTALIAAAAMLLCACGTPTGATATVIGSAAPVSQPMPANVSSAGPTPPTAQGSSPPACDPVASYRPPATMPVPGSMPAGSTMARIQARGKLVVGVDENTYLFGYLNATDGEIEGFEIDLATAVAAALFGDAAGHIQLKPITAEARIPDLLNGSVDIVVDTMTENCARWQQIAFSTEYYAATQRLLTNKNSPYKSLSDLGGQKVCAETGSTSLGTVARAAGHPIPVGVDGITDCLVMLEQGEIGAISTDDAILIGLAVQDPQTHVIGPALEAEPYGIGIAPNSIDLVRFVNGVLDRMRADGSWTALYRKWPGQLGGPVPPPPPAVYRD